MNRIVHKYSLIALMLVAAICLNAEYYETVINLTGQTLYTGLRNLIDTNTNSSYDNSRQEMFGYMDNVNGRVRCVYTGAWFNVTPGTIPDANVINTEHTFAQSWFSSTSSSVKKADLHHLFPTTNSVNSARGSLPFYTVANHSTANVYLTNTPWQSYRGSDGSGHTVFEPANQYKGDVARALLYFNVRYNDSLTRDGVNMIPQLLLWHISDPVDATESTRNTEIYQFQTNRNPFVDHPEFVARIWGGSAAEDDILLSIPALYISSAYPNPFMDGLSLSVQTKSAAPLTTTVFNMKGQKIYTTTNALPAGDNKLQWSGADSSGKAVPAGVYFIRVESGEDKAVKRVIRR